MLYEKFDIYINREREKERKRKLNDGLEDLICDIFQLNKLFNNFILANILETK